MNGQWKIFFRWCEFLLPQKDTKLSGTLKKLHFKVNSQAVQWLERSFGTGIQTDRHTDRQKDRQTDRQIAKVLLQLSYRGTVNIKPPVTDEVLLVEQSSIGAQERVLDLSTLTIYNIISLWNIWLYIFLSQLLISILELVY